MQLQGLIFDLDGTVTDTLPLCIKIYQMVFKEFENQDWDTQSVVRLFGPTEEGVLKRGLSRHVDEALKRYLQLYDEYHDGGAFLMPGICDVLEFLREHRIKMALVTGKGPETTQITLERFGLLSYFEPIKTGSAVGSIKTQCILEILADWQLDPTHVAYVGDAPSDITDAREAGILPITAAWGKPQDFYEDIVQPELMFEQTSQLMDWLQLNIALPEVDMV